MIPDIDAINAFHKKNSLQNVTSICSQKNFFYTAIIICHIPIHKKAAKIVIIILDIIVIYVEYAVLTFFLTNVTTNTNVTRVAEKTEVKAYITTNLFLRNIVA